MIRCRLNNCSTQSAPKTAECQRFGDCAWLPLNKDILPLPLTQPPPSCTWFPRASVYRARIDGLAMYAIRRETLMMKRRCGVSCMIKWQGSLGEVLWLANAVGGFCGCQCWCSDLYHIMILPSSNSSYFRYVWIHINNIKSIANKANCHCNYYSLVH